MSSSAQQHQLITLASLLQFLRAGAWCTAGVVILVQGLDPTVGAGVALLRNLELPGPVLALLGVLFLVNGGLQAWVGYHVSTWRKTKRWLLSVLVPAADALAWAELGIRLDARNESGFALTGFILCGLAALAALGVAAGRESLTGQF